jgi:SAM-dependent methyltransferase
MMDHSDTLSRLQALDAARPIVIWGAGRAGTNAVRYLRDRQIEPAAFIDSHPRVETLEGLDVHRPTHLDALRSAMKRPFVVIASMHAEAIAAQASALGLSSSEDFAILDPRAAAFPAAADPTVANFYHLLHELRGHALSDMPAGARTMLSAGCSGAWYFDWVHERYGHVPRHIGTEAYRPRPDNLPPNVEWLARDVISVPEIGDDSIDLVFSGQNIEHLWPEQVAGFLLESHRVLAPGGWLVIDSPNREITRALAWTHPEHTIEYSVADVRELLDLAGFSDIAVRGIWLCQDRDRLLPLSPFDPGSDAADVLRRAALARTRPEASFVWWAEARKSHPPQREALIRALTRLFALHWPERLNRFVVTGPTRVDADGRWLSIPSGACGLIAKGPVFPLRAGGSRLRFRVRGLDPSTPCGVRIELTRGEGNQELLAANSVACDGREASLEVEVALTDEVTFHLQVHIFATGGGAGEVLLNCEHVWDRDPAGPGTAAPLRDR